jgi:hypothetical protein
MYFPAISIGYAVPSEDFAALVHSVFQSALNLRTNGQDHLLTLIASDEGDLPQGIRLDAPDFSFGDFRVGDLVICRNGILRFGDNSLSVQLSGARRWKCDLPALKFDPARSAVSAAWNFVWDLLNEYQRLTAAEIVADELLKESARAGVPRKAGESMRGLIHATRRYDLHPSAVEQLIGLGSGLTPSGDDLLVGYLSGLWCTVQNQSERMQFLARLGETVLHLSSRTNDISRTYLYHAAQGQVSSRLSALAEAICYGEHPDRLREVAAAAFKIGHTSGMDSVTGLLIGLAAWRDAGISYL